MKKVRSNFGDENENSSANDPTDQAKFARWLLIDGWNVGGADYIEALTNGFLAEKSK